MFSYVFQLATIYFKWSIIRIWHRLDYSNVWQNKMYHGLLKHVLPFIKNFRQTDADIWIFHKQEHKYSCGEKQNIFQIESSILTIRNAFVHNRPIPQGVHSL